MKELHILKIRYILAISIGFCLFIFSNCSNEKQRAITKSETTTWYKTRIESNNLVKDEVESKYSIGYRPDGSQSFFIGLVGYNDADTLFVDKKPDYKSRKKDNKNFLYDSNDNLIGVTVLSNDTIFDIDPDNLDFVLGFQVIDDQMRILSEVDLLLGERKTYIQRKYNQFGHLTFAVVVIDYFASEVDEMIYSEIELAKKYVEYMDTLIVETDYTYF